MANKSARWSVIWAAVALLGSVGTLLCCALPAVLVALGMGAVLAGLITTAPGLVIVSQYKVLVFIVVGLCLSLAGYAHWRTRYAACPIDSQQARACQMLRRISRLILIMAIGIYAVGSFFAFGASWLLL